MWQVGQEEQSDRREQSNRGQHGFVVARPFGIPVYVTPYWFVIAGVFSVIYANDLSSTISGNTRYIVAATFVVLLYASVLVHELSHSLVPGATACRSAVSCSPARRHLGDRGGRPRPQAASSPWPARARRFPWS